MNKFTRVGLILVIVLTCFSFAPRAAQAYGGSSSTCSSLSLSGAGFPPPFFGTFDTGDTIIITVSGTPIAGPVAPISLMYFPPVPPLVLVGGSFGNTMTATIPYPMSGMFITTLSFAPLNSYSITCKPYAPPYQNYATDGRINAWDVNYAPVAIYQSSTGIKVYAADPATGEGVLVLTVSQGKISSTDSISQNTLLGQAANPFSGQMISLYRLTTGEFSLVTAETDGKPYVGVWAAGASDFYHP